jgi:uncharacterized protein YciU (UPF0263 family)
MRGFEFIFFPISENKNTKAMQILRENLTENMPLDYLCENSNDIAIEILQQNLDKIDWYWFSLNTNEGAIEILRQNQDKIDWEQFSKNPSIFEKCGYELK